MSKTLEEVSKQLQKIDFCMLSTRGETGPFSTRPMSNNGALIPKNWIVFNWSFPR
ncbi:hypothetical protein FHW37_1231 [Neorhizobium alkalisoli]|uniref:Uncharacterized protein n=1 Tax=Neorhizobium alkalisoli TaxID=528178 RepID=A0A561PVR9_9HYPH|nr:hypothetical protein [Neorhizobium alkalisoli]TWF42223.1 hypothetical protein FHW37_1231 [Neorhizobium alkalisoli]